LWRVIFLNQTCIGRVMSLIIVKPRIFEAVKYLNEGLLEPLEIKRQVIRADQLLTNNKNPGPLDNWEGFYELRFRNKLMGLIHVLPWNCSIPHQYIGLTRLIFDIRWPPGPYTYTDNEGKPGSTETYPNFLQEIRDLIINEYQQLYGNKEGEQETVAGEIKLLGQGEPEYKLNENASQEYLDLWKKFLKLRKDPNLKTQIQIATALGISPRTLQRMFDNVGQSWKNWKI
jgi:AraC-like DNA-binding protein